MENHHFDLSDRAVLHKTRPCLAPPIKNRGVSGIRDSRFILLTVVRDNCRGSHGIQASAANSLVNFAQNDSTVLHSHMLF